MRIPFLSVLLVATIAACSTTQQAPGPTGPTIVTAERPLQVSPAGFDPKAIRADLVATAAERFGQAAAAQALASPTYVFAKRYAGMLPPPPPGETSPPYVPSAALMMRASNGWMVATNSGWRPAKADTAAEIDAVLADPRLWAEPAYTPPCPDYGSAQLILKVPGRPETVRNSTCSSIAEKIVHAALRA